MPIFAAIQNGLVSNILDAPTKEIAEEASGLPCVDYDHKTHPAIGWVWDGTTFNNGEITNE